MGLDVLFRCKDLDEKENRKVQEKISEAGLFDYYFDEPYYAKELYSWGSRSHPGNEILESYTDCTHTLDWTPIEDKELNSMLECIDETLNWGKSLSSYPTNWRDIDIDVTRKLIGLCPIRMSYPPTYKGLMWDNNEYREYAPALESWRGALGIIIKNVDLTKHPIEVLWSIQKELKTMQKTPSFTIRRRQYAFTGKDLSRLFGTFSKPTFLKITPEIASRIPPQLLDYDAGEGRAQAPDLASATRATWAALIDYDMSIEEDNDSWTVPVVICDLPKYHYIIAASTIFYDPATKSFTVVGR